MQKKFRFFLYFFMAGMITANAQSFNNDSLGIFIQQKADSLYRKSKVPGIFIGVLNGKQRQYFDVGFAVPDQQKRFDATTIFEAGSITKTFTAYILNAVLEDNHIADTVSILSFLPDSVQTNKALAGISFLQLLNHTSGFPRLPTNMLMDGSAEMAPYDNYTASHLYAYLKTASPVASEKPSYSNLGMGLAGVLAERISKKSFATLLDEYVLIPFGVIEKTKPSDESSNKSQGYFDTSKVAYWNMDVMAPAGGLKCNATEMLQYLQSMSVPVNQQSKNRIEKLLQPTAAMSPQVKVCRGWFTLDVKDKGTIYWHNGGTFGFSTFAAFLKDKSKAVIVVVNKTNSNNVSDKLGMEIIKKLF
ncbi:MAG: serine hydrolase domain-containing protein [Ferruginibacter sp.]